MLEPENPRIIILKIREIKIQERRAEARAMSASINAIEQETEHRVDQTLERGKTLRQRSEVEELRRLITDTKPLAESLNKVENLNIFVFFSMQPNK